MMVAAQKPNRRTVYSATGNEPTGMDKDVSKANQRFGNDSCERHSSPLISQTDLFLRCKVEADETAPRPTGLYNHRNEQRQSRRSGQDRSHDKIRGQNRSCDKKSNSSTNGGSRSKDTRGYTGLKRPDNRSGSDRSAISHVNSSQMVSQHVLVDCALTHCHYSLPMAVMRLWKHVTWPNLKTNAKPPAAPPLGVNF